VGHKGYIVVIETDELVRGLLESWLSDAGYTVIIGDYEKRVHDDEPLLVVANVPSPRPQEPLMRALGRLYAAPILALSARFRRGLSPDRGRAPSRGSQSAAQAVYPGRAAGGGARFARGLRLTARQPLRLSLSGVAMGSIALGLFAVPQPLSCSWSAPTSGRCERRQH